MIWRLALPGWGIGLHLSANTVSTHLRNLMTKPGAHSTLEVVAMTRSMLNIPLGNGDDSAPPL